MTERLPPHLLRLFMPRPAIKHVRPLDRDLTLRRGPTVDGIAAYLDQFATEADPNAVPVETPTQRRKRVLEEKRIKHESERKAALEAWDPHNDPHASGDPYKTLFIGRLSYEAKEEDIRRVFERYGKIANVQLVHFKDTEKSRGYAFIEFESERDMKAAYKDADGLKILDRRIVVDVERGRTVKDWHPKRLGGGLGQTRVGRPDENQRYSGRDPTIGGGYQPADEARSRYADRYNSSSRSYDGRSGSGHPREHSDRGGDSRYRGRSRSPRRDYRDRERERGRERERDSDGHRRRDYEDRHRDSRGSRDYRDSDRERSGRDRDRSHRH